MTLGEKIRKYRLLKGLTLKELGEKAFKLKRGADVKINQYERGYAAPKMDAREALAKELDVDLNALSDAGYSTDEDIMYILFALEEERGLKVLRENGQIHLVFDLPNKENNNEQLVTYLYFWENEAAKDLSSEEASKEYERWKARFSSNVNGYLKEKEDAIKVLYSDDVKKITDNGELAEETQEVTKLLQQIVDAGFILSVKLGLNDIVGYSFEVNQLLNPTNEDNKKLFARFLAEINHFNQLGADCYTKMALLNDKLTITYYIPVPGLYMVGDHISGYINKLNDPNKSDFKLRRQVELFDSVRKNIKDEIKEYVAIRDGK